MRNIFYKILYFLIITFLSASCSQNSHKWLPRNYHNMAARYNCYFLAKEKMLEIDQRLLDNHQDDYNNILPAFPPLDTNFSQSLSGDLDYVFEKGKLPIHKHKNSNWIAESYNIIGKAKWYGNKKDTAQYIYKYVLAKVSDNPGRQISQIYLLKLYLNQQEDQLANEEYVALKKQKIFPKNEKEFTLACLDYHYYYKEYDEMVPLLEKLIQLENKKDKRARINFILGQINQRNSLDKKAAEFYKKATKRNPPYEIEFNAKLNLAQVTDINDKTEIKKINKLYDKMILDKKNEDYLARIYYERAKFELKQNHLQKGISYLKTSLQVPNTASTQKAYSYYLLGKLFYEKVDSLPTKVEKYTQAKLYYDSTVSGMAYDFENAEAIKVRQEILSRFVGHLQTIEKEERLQRWATLSEDELQKEVKTLMDIDKKKLEDEYKKQQAIEKLAAEVDDNDDFEDSPMNTFVAPELGQKGFFAYDPVQVLTQKNRFIEVWGTRPLEDHWRRSKRDKNIDLNNTVFPDDTLNIEKTSANQVDQEEIKIELNPDDYTQDIPKSEEEITYSNFRLQEARYQVGKIFYYELLETPNAQETFESYIQSHPGAEHEAEVIYFQYLICKKLTCDIQKYKTLEYEKYPNSSYYKLMEDENYFSNNASDNRLSHELYAQAYSMYQSGEYVSCVNTLNTLKSQYPKTDILDKVVFLETLTYAQTDQLVKYYSGMEDFIKKFGTSPLKVKAEEILSFQPENLDSYAKKNESFVRNDDVNHYFMAYFPKKEMPLSRITEVYTEFHKNYAKEVILSTKTIEWSQSHYLLSKKSFKNYASANEYLEKLNHFHEFGEHLKKVPYYYFIISEPNYNSLIQQKNLVEYKQFFEKSYGIKQ